MTSRSSERRRSATAAFFDDLNQRGREPLLNSAAGSIRFDLVDGDHVEAWTVTIDHGDVDVSRSRRRADAIVRLDKSMFNRMVLGKVNAMAATWKRSDGDIADVLKTLFDSAEFNQSLGKKFKDPMHYAVSAVRARGAPAGGALRGS